MKRLSLALALLLAAPVSAAPTSLNAQLMQAVDQGKEAQVKALLQKGASVNARNGDKVTALMLASQHSQFRIVDMLLAKGANVKARDGWGYTALGYTVENALLETLVAHGARASVKDSGVLADSLDGAVWSDSDIEDKDVEAAALLIVKAGADINDGGEDEGKLTPLLNAVETRPTIVKLLLDLGAKPNVGNIDGRTPLMAVASSSFTTNLAVALSTARLLLARGANINQRDNDGATALIGAARKNRWELVRFLISNGANVNAQDVYGFTALMHAATAGNAEMAKLLLKAGAKPDLKDKQGGTALARAQSTTLTSAQWFIAGGLSQDDEKEDLATLNGRRAIIKLLKAQ